MTAGKCQEAECDVMTELLSWKQSLHVWSWEVSTVKYTSFGRNAAQQF